MDLNEEQLNQIIEELGIEIVNPQRGYWLVRAGKEGAFFDEFLTRGFTGIGYGLNEIEIIRELSKEEIKSKIEELYPDEKQPGHIARKIFNFFHEIKKGDVIVMPSAGRKTVAFGIVKDDVIYFDDSLIMEQSIEKIDSEDYDIPNKRRKISWRKPISSKFLQPKLILNLFSPHGLSGITEPEIIKLIDVNMNDIFIKEDTGYLTFQINKEKDIDLKALSNLMDTLGEISFQITKESLSIQINLNSPGKLTVYGKKIAIISLLIFAGIVGAFGGNFKTKNGNEVSSNGASGLIMEFIKENNKHTENLEEIKIKYIESIGKLDIDEAEKIKLIREKISFKD